MFNKEVKLVTPGMPLCRDQWPKIAIADTRGRWMRTFFETEDDAAGHFDVTEATTGGLDGGDSIEHDLEAAAAVTMTAEREELGDDFDTFGGGGGGRRGETGGTPSRPSKASRRVVPLPEPDGDASPPRGGSKYLASPSISGMKLSELTLRDLSKAITKACRPSWAPAGLCPCMCPMRPPLVIYKHWDAIVRVCVYLLLILNALGKVAILRVYTERDASSWVTFGILLFVAGIVAPCLAMWRYGVRLWAVHGVVLVRRWCTKYEVEDEPVVTMEDAARVALERPAVCSEWGLLL